MSVKRKQNAPFSPYHHVMCIRLIAITPLYGGFVRGGKLGFRALFVLKANSIFGGVGYQ
jgi:hypothetical protein